MHNYNLPTAKEGNTFLAVQMELPNEPAYNLTGATIKMDLKPNLNAATVATLSNTGENPKIEIISDYGFQIIEHNLEIPPGLYGYDILIIFASGARSTYVGGTWRITPAYTKHP